MGIDNTRLAGKVAIVTGAASGIGAATSRRLAAEGARVLLTDIQDEVGSDLAAEIGNEAKFQHCNVVSESDVAAAVQTAIDTWGRLDILHNNAGFVGVSGPIESTTAEGWANTLEILLTSVFYGTKHATPAMRDSGGGSIVNTASVCGLRAGIGTHAYTVAKHGVIGLTRSTALELAEYNIRVNAVCPGYIATGLSAGRSRSEIDEAEMAERLEKARGWANDAQAMNRMGEPEDIAAAVAWLASDDSEWVTGTEQVVDGGLLNGRAWRKLPKTITEDRPIRLYAPGTYD